ncbi:hypothetical protein [Aestuariispira insulae]|uniref:Uncharacterized protein n=1 Tax=Aestuariispira insulae TaxID=1461337 RepID=A0A3D9HJZ2_9PROT|nr:hypothetical protein [Aestuariispira insulae]RED49832.1 hypothetical protein DFP90_105204 [Aestuariispira insulae]
MSTYRFTLHEDSISPGGWMHILTGGANRALICLMGSAGLEAQEPLFKEQATCATGASMVTTGHDGALILRWELALAEDEEEIESAGVTSRILSSVEIDLEEGEDYIFRVESLGLPPKDWIADQEQVGDAINACLQGKFLLISGDTEETEQKQAEAWFEADGAKFSLKANEEEPSLLVRAVVIAPDRLDDIAAIPVSANENGDEPKRFDKMLAEGVAAL